MSSRAASIGILLALTACGGGSSPQHHVDASPPTPDAPPDAPPISANAVAIPLHSVSALTYTAPLSLAGTQSLQVIVDTGSSTLAVASATCTNCGVSPLYMPGTSAVDKHTTTSSQYGDGSGWNAEVFEDLVGLGSAGAVTVDFGAITTSNGFFRSFDGGPIPYEGIMGLGPDALLTQGTTSYVSNSITAGMSPAMAFQLCPDSGTMWLGGVDPAAEASAPVTTPMVSHFPFYAVHVDDLSVGDTSIGATSAQLGPTIIDTGTTVSFIPPAALNKLSTAISSSAGYTAVFGSQPLSDQNCMTTSKTAAQIDAMMPPLSVAFTGATGTAADLPATKSYLFDAGGGMWCFAFSDASQLFGTTLTASLYGDSLLTGYTTIFDIGSHQMDFALQNGCHEAQLVSSQPAPHYRAGTPWWKQDPRARVPSPEVIQRRLAAYAATNTAQP